VFFDFIVAINGINLEPKASIFVGVLNSIRSSLKCFQNNSSFILKEILQREFCKNSANNSGMNYATIDWMVQNFFHQIQSRWNWKSLLDAFGIVFFSRFMNSFSTTKSPQSKLTEGSAQAR